MIARRGSHKYRLDPEFQEAVNAASDAAADAAVEDGHAFGTGPSPYDRSIATAAASLAKAILTGD